MLFFSGRLAVGVSLTIQKETKARIIKADAIKNSTYYQQMDTDKMCGYFQSTIYEC